MKKTNNCIERNKDNMKNAMVISWKKENVEQ